MACGMQLKRERPKEVANPALKRTYPFAWNGERTNLAVNRLIAILVSLPLVDEIPDDLQLSRRDTESGCQVLGIADVLEGPGRSAHCETRIGRSTPGNDSFPTHAPRPGLEKSSKPPLVRGCVKVDQVRDMRPDSRKPRKPKRLDLSTTLIP